jgi:hypothetical protein
MVEFYDPIAKQDISYHLDENLKVMWDRLRDGKLAAMNEDRVYVVDGRERTGKSSFTFQQAKYLDPTFTVENICFKPEDFLSRLRNAKKGSVIVFDEAFRGLSSKSSRSKVNKAIVEALMEVGQRNLIVFIVLPTLFLLEIYAAVFRTEGLFHIYKMKAKKASGSSHRAFKIYNYRKKKELYLRGKTKYFSYTYPKIKRAKGRFYAKPTKDYPAGSPYETFDMKAYLHKKDYAFRNIGEMEEDESSKYVRYLHNVIRGVKKDYTKTLKATSDWCKANGYPVSKSMVGTIMHESAESPKKIQFPQPDIILNNGFTEEEE